MSEPDPFREQVLRALSDLEAGLVAGRDASDPRQAAGKALQASIDFINCFEWLREQNLTAPLFGLLTALNDLRRGVRAPVLEPAKSERGISRPGKNTPKRLMQAFAIYGVDVLKDMGEPLEGACKFVAAQLAKAGHRTQGQPFKPKWTEVKTWRDEASRKPSSARPPDEQISDTLTALRERFPFPTMLPTEAKPIVAEMLQNLSRDVGRFG